MLFLMEGLFVTDTVEKAVMEILGDRFNEVIEDTLVRIDGEQFATVFREKHSHDTYIYRNC